MGKNRRITSDGMCSEGAREEMTCLDLTPMGLFERIQADIAIMRALLRDFPCPLESTHLSMLTLVQRPYMDYLGPLLRPI